MTTQSHKDFHHSHNYLQEDEKIAKNEKRTFYVVLLTSLMMIVEIITGYLTGSMALLADGWHMASHAGALSISLIVYKLAKSRRLNDKFAFGAGKFIPLGGYTSAILLAFVALLMMAESIERFISPQSIQFNEAILVAIVGLIVNVTSAFLLSGDNHHHGHGSDHHHHHDHNLKSAYIHVLADALTSILAIFALLIGKHFGAIWLDPVMGIVGAIVILKWAYNLCKDTGWELMDGHVKTLPPGKIKDFIEKSDVKVTDLHLWRIAPNALACEVSLVSEKHRGASFYKDLLKKEFGIRHIVIEENLI